MDTMKNCRRCATTKDVSSFSSDKSRIDGLSAYCRPCDSARRGVHYRAHIEERKAYDRARPQADRNEDQARWRKRNADKVRLSVRVWRMANPERVRSMLAGSLAVRAALRSGALVRPDRCALCLEECKPDAAHADYRKPLEVQWLCRRCHVLWDHAFPKTLTA